MSNELFSIEDELSALRERITALQEAVATGRALTNAQSRAVRINDLCALASEELRERSRRAAHFPGTLFGEPAWDILLDLYVHACKGLEVSITSACLAAGVPPTTGLRWIGLLENEKYIARRPSERDRRAVILDLTPNGRARIERTLSERLHRRSLSLLFNAPAGANGAGRGQAIADTLLILESNEPPISQ